MYARWPNGDLFHDAEGDLCGPGEIFVDDSGHACAPGDPFVDRSGHLCAPDGLFIDGGGHCCRPTDLYMDGRGYLCSPGTPHAVALHGGASPATALGTAAATEARFRDAWHARASDIHIERDGRPCHRGPGSFTREQIQAWQRGRSCPAVPSMQPGPAAGVRAGCRQPADPGMHADRAPRVAVQAHASAGALSIWHWLITLCLGLLFLWFGMGTFQMVWKDVAAAAATTASSIDRNRAGPRGARPDPAGVSATRPATPRSHAAGVKAVQRVQSPALHLRVRPGSGQPVITILARDTRVQILAEVRTADGGTWLRVRSGTYEGWVNGKFLTED